MSAAGQPKWGKCQMESNGSVIPDNARSCGVGKSRPTCNRQVIKAPGVEACGRHGVEITFNVAVQAASFVQVKIPPRLASAR